METLTVFIEDNQVKKRFWTGQEYKTETIGRYDHGCLKMKVANGWETELSTELLQKLTAALNAKKAEEDTIRERQAIEARLQAAVETAVSELLALNNR